MKTLWWCLWGVTTCRLQYPVGCHLVCSYLCPAQVGGGADLSFFSPLCFSLSGMFSWPGFDMAEPQLNNHSSDSGGVQSFTPASRDLEKLSQGRMMVVVVVEVWIPGECSFIDGWYMWNRIKREDFGRAAVFTVVFGWVALFLSWPVFFFFSPFFFFISSSNS